MPFRCPQVNLILQERSATALGGVELRAALERALTSAAMSDVLPERQLKVHGEEGGQLAYTLTVRCDMVSRGI